MKHPPLPTITQAWFSSWNMENESSVQNEEYYEDTKALYPDHFDNADRKTVTKPSLFAEMIYFPKEFKRQFKCQFKCQAYILYVP